MTRQSVYAEPMLGMILISKQERFSLATANDNDSHSRKWGLKRGRGGRSRQRRSICSHPDTKKSEIGSKKEASSGYDWGVYVIEN